MVDGSTVGSSRKRRPPFAGYRGCQSLQYDQSKTGRKRYKADISDVVPDFELQGLPGNHGIKMRTRQDGQAWYGWRVTIAGWVSALAPAGLRRPNGTWNLYDDHYLIRSASSVVCLHAGGLGGSHLPGHPGGLSVPWLPTPATGLTGQLWSAARREWCGTRLHELRAAGFPAASIRREQFDFPRHRVRRHRGHPGDSGGHVTMSRTDPPRT